MSTKKNWMRPEQTPSLSEIYGGQPPAKSQRSERTGNNANMATDGMQGLRFAALCDVVQAAFEARPDVDHDTLQALGNALCQLAEKELRERT